MLSINAQKIKRKYKRLRSVIRSLTSVKTWLHPVKKCIFYDVSFLSTYDNKTGISRVVKAIFRELKKTEKLRRYEIVPVWMTFGANKLFLAYCEQDANGILFVQKRLIVKPKEGDIFLSFDADMNVQSSNKLFLQDLKKEGCRVIIGIHDLLPLKLREVSFLKKHVKDFGRWLNNLQDIAEFVCISRTTEMDLWEYFRASSAKTIKICHFMLGVDPKSVNTLSDAPPKLKKLLDKGGSISRKINFLMVGTIEPRKCHDFILKTFEILWKEYSNLNLFIVGKKGWMVDEFYQRLITHPKVGTNLFYLGQVSDSTLYYLYQNCDCLICPSLDEGFGLPVIEAAMHGTSLIVRDIPIFREVAGKGAFFFGAKGEDELSREILDWVHLFQINTHPKSAKVPILSWTEATSELIKVLRL